MHDIPVPIDIAPLCAKYLMPIKHSGFVPLLSLFRCSQQQAGERERRELYVAEQLWHICISYIVVQIGEQPPNCLDGIVGKAKLNQDLRKLIAFTTGGWALWLVVGGDQSLWPLFNELLRKKNPTTLKSNSAAYKSNCTRRKGPGRE